MSMFTRGYGDCREKVSKNPKYARSCFNCADYYQASGDKEEVCQNPNVIPYDMVITDTQIYCVNWRPSSIPEKDTIFQKTGRAKLD